MGVACTILPNEHTYTRSLRRESSVKLLVCDYVATPGAPGVRAVSIEPSQICANCSRACYAPTQCGDSTECWCYAASKAVAIGRCTDSTADSSIGARATSQLQRRPRRSCGPRRNSASARLLASGAKPILQESSSVCAKSSRQTQPCTCASCRRLWSVRCPGGLPRGVRPRCERGRCLGPWLHRQAQHATSASSSRQWRNPAPGTMYPRTRAGAQTNRRQRAPSPDDLEPRRQATSPDSLCTCSNFKAQRRARRAGGRGRGISGCVDVSQERRRLRG